MEHYGIQGMALQWYVLPYTDRKQYVYLNGHASALKEISCGTPQGSVLGPLLFLIYIWAYGVVVSMFDFHCSDQGLNPGRGGKIS